MLWRIVFLLSFLQLNCSITNPLPESRRGTFGRGERERTWNNPCFASAKRESNLELAGKSIPDCRIEDRTRIPKIIPCGGETHSPLLENSAACRFISASWGPSSHWKSRAVRGQNASPWLLPGCQEAGLCWALQWGTLPAPGAVAAFLGAPVFPSLHWECAIFFHPILLPPAWLRFVFRWQMPTAFLPVLVGHQGTGWPCRKHPLPGTLLPVSQVSVSSRCCDIMTNTQALMTGCLTSWVSESLTSHQS